MTSKLQLDVFYQLLFVLPELVVALSDERLRRKGRYGVFADKTVIHA